MPKEKLQKRYGCGRCGCAYRRIPGDMVMVILTRRQSVELKRFVRSVDRRAFVIMADVSEVVGEGFKKWEADS